MATGYTAPAAAATWFIAEALAEVAMGRHRGLVTGQTFNRLKEAKAQLRAMGIEPPEEPEQEWLGA